VHFLCTVHVAATAIHAQPWRQGTGKQSIRVTESHRRLLRSRAMVEAARRSKAPPVLIVSANRLRRLRRQRGALRRVVRVPTTLSKTRSLRRRIDRGVSLRSAGQC